MRPFLIRVMSTYLYGACFHNYVVYASEIESARHYAVLTFGAERVGSVDFIESVSILPLDIAAEE